MMTGRDDALMIFEKWREEERPVRVQGSFAFMGFTFWGRIDSLTSKEIRLRDVKTQFEFAISFAPELMYSYGDNRLVEGEAKKFGDAIMIHFPSDTETPNFVLLGALGPP